MKNSILKYTFITLSALFISSCAEDSMDLDTTKPEINLISPKDEAHFHLGDEITIEAILKDNVELGTVKVEIHSAGDGHQHKSAAVNWEYDAEEAIPSGKIEHTFTHKVKIPAEGIKGGHYHLGIFLIDKAGNQSQSFIEIDVVDENHEH